MKNGVAESGVSWADMLSDGYRPSNSTLLILELGVRDPRAAMSEKPSNAASYVAPLG